MLLDGPPRSKGHCSSCDAMRHDSGRSQLLGDAAHGDRQGLLRVVPPGVAGPEPPRLPGVAALACAPGQPCSDGPGTTAPSGPGPWPAYYFDCLLDCLLDCPLDCLLDCLCQGLRICVLAHA